MKDLDQFEYDNEEEAEMAQIQSLQMNAQALSQVQQRLALQRSQPSAEFCEDCGETIPKLRRKAIPGVQLCVECQSRSERIRANYRQPGDYTE